MGESPLRWYARLTFDAPVPAADPQTCVVLERGNVPAGTPCPAIAWTLADRTCTEVVTLKARGIEGKDSCTTSCSYTCVPGLTRRTFEALPAGLVSEDYAVTWRAERGGAEGETKLTILPEFDPGRFGERLAAVRSGLSSGSATTFEFNIQRTAGLLADLPFYEVASYERRVILSLDELLQRAEQGEDPYTRRTGYTRRAFRSRLDGTLQPYVVHVPEGYDPARVYPLVVFLHGSASDETDIVGHSFISRGDVIEAGPLGRGPSNGFASDEAQVDVAEAIADVLANYPIDRERIVLTGFSMGGYGVYHTFHETPQTFCAAAVFSGAATFPAESALDFHREENLAAFRDVPLFIYHGEQDRNLPFDRVAALAGELRAAGAHVEFVSEADKGHEAPGEETIARYHAWLDRVLAEGR